MHHMHWTGGKEFRKTGDVHADWVLVQRRTRYEEGNVKLDGRTVGKLQGLFRVSDGMQIVHEVAFVRLLWVKASRRPYSEKG